MNAYGMPVTLESCAATVKGIFTSASNKVVNYNTSRTQLDIRSVPPNSCHTFLSVEPSWEWFGLLPNSLFFAMVSVCFIEYSFTLVCHRATAFSIPLLHMRVSRDSIRTSTSDARSDRSISAAHQEPPPSEMAQSPSTESGSASARGQGQARAAPRGRVVWSENRRQSLQPLYENRSALQLLPPASQRTVVPADSNQ